MLSLTVDSPSASRVFHRPIKALFEPLSSLKTVAAFRAEPTPFCTTEKSKTRLASGRAGCLLVTTAYSPVLSFATNFRTSTGSCSPFLSDNSSGPGKTARSRA